MNPLALLAFMVVIMLLLLLPMLPAWREWRRPTDRHALPVLRSHTSDIDFFADQFRRAVLIEGATRRALSTSLFDYVRTPLDQMQWHAARRPLISMIALQVRRAIRMPAPLFVQADMDVAHGSRFNAILATGALRLGPSCEIHQWAHADGSLTLGRGGVGMRRLSSGVQVRLDIGCLFERVSAPVICFGAAYPLFAADPQIDRQRAPERTSASYADLPGACRRSTYLHRIEGDCRLPAGRRYHGCLVVTGSLIVGAGTCVTGDIKAYRNLRLDAGAQVDGAVVCEAGIDVGPDVWVRGPIVAETRVALAGGSRIGTPADGTTVGAAVVVAQPGATVHGALWAREAGIVAPA